MAFNIDQLKKKKNKKKKLKTKTIIKEIKKWINFYEKKKKNILIN